MRKILRVSFLIIIVGFGLLGQVNGFEYFPLEKGNYWIYEGNVRWTNPGENTIQEKKVIWRMEVLDVVKRNHVMAARLKGHPYDLAWYAPGKERGDFLIVCLVNKYYLVDDDELITDVLNRIKDPADNLKDLVNDSKLFLDAPLMKNKVFGGEGDSQLFRQDFMYVWLVEDVRLENSYKKYRLAFRSLPDHTIVDFIPGIGIENFIYVHHGTVSEANVKLKKWSVK